MSSNLKTPKTPKEWQFQAPRRKTFALSSIDFLLGSLVNRLHANNSSFSVQLPPVNGKDRQNHLPIVVHMYTVHHETTAFYCRYR